MIVKPIAWSEVQEPNKECSYHHVTAETPFGSFLITWKGWKESDSPTIDETPWGDWFDCGHDLEDAKENAEKEYRARVIQCLGMDRIEKEAGL